MRKTSEVAPRTILALRTRKDQWRAQEWTRLKGVEESIETLQKQGFLEFKQAHEKLGQLVQMVSEVLNMASATGLAVRLVCPADNLDAEGYAAHPTLPSPLPLLSAEGGMTKRRRHTETVQDQMPKIVA